MSTTDFTILTADGQNLPVSVFPAEGAADAPVIQILHGMAEHAGRYQAFAAQLQRAGYTVWLHNHRGHADRLPAGHLARGEWALLLDDIARIQDTLPDGRRLILFGHSMGSFIARDFLCSYPQRADALILSGTGSAGALRLRAGRAMVAAVAALSGADKPSRFLSVLGFGSFNKRIADARTPADWLSRDPAAVQAYLSDPLCGRDCTPSFWYELTSALIRIHSKQAYRALPPSLPVYLFSGAEDPVGNYGKGVRQVRDALLEGGVRDVQMRLYGGGRHEMLQETNTEEVVRDLLEWLQRHA
ncbi:alpha/beta fold hydrolase [Granulosicoccaceae sp. 1_MG-2023]|nr:alpha/beta fold hydrolase [Granulosicoccaceae sp. 1_MG-2023]